MGIRIGALWPKHDGEGNAYLAGELNVETGINIPAGHRMGVALKKNEKYEENGKQPKYFIEAWNYETHPDQRPASGDGGEVQP
jgi:hypothetical protein